MFPGDDLLSRRPSTASHTTPAKAAGTAASTSWVVVQRFRLAANQTALTKIAARPASQATIGMRAEAKASIGAAATRDGSYSARKESTGSRLDDRCRNVSNPLATGGQT